MMLNSGIPDHVPSKPSGSSNCPAAAGSAKRPRHHPRSTVRHKGIGKDDNECSSCLKMVLSTKLRCFATRKTDANTRIPRPAPRPGHGGEGPGASGPRQSVTMHALVSSAAPQQDRSRQMAGDECVPGVKFRQLVNILAEHHHNHHQHRRQGSQLKLQACASWHMDADKTFWTCKLNETAVARMAKQEGMRVENILPQMGHVLFLDAHGAPCCPRGKDWHPARPRPSHESGVQVRTGGGQRFDRRECDQLDAHGRVFAVNWVTKSKVDSELGRRQLLHDACD